MWTDAILFVNTGSGGRKGAGVLRYYQHVLGEANCFDLGLVKSGEWSPIDAIRDWARLNADNPKKDGRILVCGGDGTANWIMSSVDQLHTEGWPKFMVVVIPVGTGNDLAQVFGWPKGYQSSMLSLLYFTEMMQASRATLDR
jgi:diacylglycerol kinase (ATP)